MHMIAVHESTSTYTVLVFKTLRGYLGGNTEPVDFDTTHRTIDENLVSIGYKRTTDWQPVPNRPGVVYVPVKRS